jgi:hypothetical protein
MPTQIFYRWRAPGHGLCSVLVRDQSYTEEEARIIGSKMGVVLTRIEGSAHGVRAAAPASSPPVEMPYF